MNTSVSRRFLQSVAVCGLAAMFVGGAVTASAAMSPFVQTQSTKVSFADLDLNKPAGAKELYRRIKQAARKVCSDTALHYDLITNKSISECQRVAIANAVSSVNNSQLTALHNGNRGKSNRVG